jgi:hypothetical protein
MTRCWPGVVVTTLCWLLGIATAAHAESAWMLWQQATVFTESWWSVSLESHRVDTRWASGVSNSG